MKIIHLISFAFFSFWNINCQSQNNNTMDKQNVIFQCSPDSGVCEIPMNKSKPVENKNWKKSSKPVKIIYYTDPICSSCWGIEPQLRKLKLEYGNIIEFDYRMGGLLPDWNYNAGGISKPSDVANHWDEVSLYYDMPIDGDVWLEDPLSSSYPPSIAFKAAQIQDNNKAILFLREIREMVFLQKKNISIWEHLESAGKKVGLDIVQLKIDFNGKAKELFEEDLQLSKDLGIRGFPTMILLDSLGQKKIIYGSRPYNEIEATLLKLESNASRVHYSKEWDSVFKEFNSMTAKEFSMITESSRSDSEKKLNDLVNRGHVKRFDTKNGSIWFKNK